MKRFRYMVESFLPEKSEAWGEELSHAQDLLGEGHDLDVLRALIVKLFQKKKSLRKAETAVAKALRRVDAAAQKRREEYAELVCATAEEREPQAAAIDTEAEAAVGSAAGAGLAPERQSLWDRWRAELLSMAKVSGRGGAEPSRSAARRGSRAKASANRYPGRRRRISSAT